MQISIKSVRQNQSGFILTVTLTFLLVTLIIFASIMYWVTSSARVTQQNNLFNISQAAAQAAAEITIAQMDRDFIYQSINNSNVYMPLVVNIDQSSWPVKFKFSDTNGTANQINVSIYPENWATNYVALNSQFSGLFAAVAQCDLYAKATPTTNSGYNMSAIVHESMQLAAIPVFQFGVFYNLDLDIGNGQAMIMNGKVHCNGTIWMCPMALMTFNDRVEASIIVTNADNPSDQQNHTFSSSNLKYVITLNNPVSGADTLNMPINGVSSNPTNLEAIINLPPAGVAAPAAAAYYPSNQIYLYNECDLIISNSASGINGALGTNITIFYQDQTISPYFYQLTNNEICTFQKTNGPASLPALWTTNSPYRPTTNYAFFPVASSFPFVTNVTFYDFREGDQVQAVQIDIAQLNIWLTNTAFEGYKWNLQCGGTYGMGGSSAGTGNKGHPIDSIYVYNSVQRTYSQLPAVRVVNGQQLPSHWGLSVSTPWPLYVMGDYNIQTNASGSKSVLTTNTAWTWPSALMGDAITILSSNWVDNGSAYTNGGSGSRNTVNTTINAACFEGIVPSITTGGTKHYSGGLENFLRLLENWNSTLCYNGSIVVMFPSIYATNYWGTGYYSVPTRQWGFDANFTSINKMPPCAPQAKAIIRGNWVTGGK
jgi:hypothetical protein